MRQKICKSCAVLKFVNEFREMKLKGRNPYPKAHCIPCERTIKSKWINADRKKNPARYKEAKRQYAERHPDRVRASSKIQNDKWNANPKNQIIKKQYQKHYYKTNKENLCESRRQWGIHNRERIKQSNQKYTKQKSREYFREMSRKSYAKNRAGISERRRRYRQEGRFKHFRLIRRARLKGAKGHTSQVLLNQKLLYYDGRCRYCKIILDKSNLSFDHAIPVTRGGSNWTSNLLPCCRRCNSKKGTRTFKEFIQG